MGSPQGSRGYLATTGLALLAGGVLAGAWLVFSQPAPSDPTTDSQAHPAAQPPLSATEPPQARQTTAEPTAEPITESTAKAPVEPNPEPNPAPAVVASAQIEPLLAFQGALIAVSAEDAEVFVHGVPSGRTNERIVTRCGWKNVRLRNAEKVWLTPGQVVKLPCQQDTRVEIQF